MTQRTYRTAQGKVVDLGALQLKNENVRAVGNMPVNARGDRLDSNNRPIDSRNQQVARQYQKQVTNVQDEPVVSSKQRAAVEQPRPTATPVPTTAPTAPVESAENDSGSGGLAAAIARARQVKQTAVEPQSQQSRQQSGVKKI